MCIQHKMKQLIFIFGICFLFTSCIRVHEQDKSKHGMVIHYPMYQKDTVYEYGVDRRKYPIMLVVPNKDSSK